MSSTKSDMKADSKPLTMHEATRQFLKNSAKTILIFNVLFIVFLLFFLGSAWAPAEEYDRIHIALANYDDPTGYVGQQLLPTYSAGISQGRLQKFTYTIIDTNKISYQALRSQIDNGDYHAGYVVIPKATAILENALSTYNARAAAAVPFRIEPPSVLHLVYDEGRGGIGISNLVKITGFSYFSQFNYRLAGKLSELSRDAAMYPQLASAPAALLGRPLKFYEDRLHIVPTMGSANIGAFVWSVLYAITFGLVLTTEAVWKPAAEAGIRKDHVMGMQLAHTFTTTLFVSVWPISVIGMLGMQITANQYFQLWALMWLSQTTFALVSASVAAATGKVMVGLLVSIFFYILNLISSTATYPMEFMNEFFKIGYGLPMYQGVSGARTILFGSYDRLDRNIGLLFVWFGVLLTAHVAFIFRARSRVLSALSTPPATTQESESSVVTVKVEIKSSESESKSAESAEPSPAPTTPAAPVATKSFFASDPEILHVRRKLIKPSALVTIIFSSLCLILVLIFLGASWKPEDRYSNFKIAVADYDGDIVGSALLDSLALYGHGPAGNKQLLNFAYKRIDTKTVSLSTLRDLVDRGDYSAAYIAPPGASADLRSALNNALALPRYARLQFTFDEGRAGGLVASLMRRGGQEFTYYANGLLSERLHAMPFTGLGAADAHVILGQPLKFSEDNLHPVTKPGANNLAGQVWILILGMSIPMGSAALAITGPFTAAGKSGHGAFITVVRYLWVIFFSMTCAFWPPVFVRGMGVEMTGAQFFEIWWFLTLCMFVWASFKMILNLLIGPATGLLSIILLILSLVASTAIYPMEFMHEFFRIGYGFPLLQGVQMARTILFGSYDRRERCVGVVFAWLGGVIIVNILIILRASRHKKEDTAEPQTVVVEDEEFLQNLEQVDDLDVRRLSMEVREEGHRAHSHTAYAR